MANDRPPHRPSGERLQEDLDPHRREERDAAAAELASRLESRGITLTGQESSDQLADLLNAVERFERVVERHGGDLMVDEAPRGKTRQPDDVHFVLPERRADESVAQYIGRIDSVALALTEHSSSPRDHPR